MNPLMRIRQDVQSMHAYAVQDATGMRKMDAMENPYPLPAALQQALGARLGALPINRYPGERVQDLRVALANYVGMPADFDIMLGNGSDELISLLALACDVTSKAPDGSTKPAAILAPVPGFVMYAMSAQLQGLDFIGVPLTADFELDEPAMLAAIAQHAPAITYLAYPNNPTANLWSASAIANIIDAVAAQGGLVVMDEAYQPFASQSWLPCIVAEPARHAHVLLMRTLSKFGLAGVRLGYLMGPKLLVNALDKVRPPYNISLLNAECALFALEHRAVFEAQASDLRAQREALLAALRAMPKVQVWNSEANMVLIRVPNAERVFEGMKARKVLIKNISKMHPLLTHCLRLTVGSEADNGAMLTALQESL